MPDGPFTHSTHSQPPAVTELYPPLLAKIFYVVATGAGYVLFVFVPLLHWVTDSKTTIGDSFVNLVIVGIGFWFVTQGACRMWRDSGFSVRADESGVTLCTRKGQTHASWAQIATCTEEPRDAAGELGWWVTLRDASGHILMQWERSWYASDGAALKRFDRFTQYLESRVNEPVNTTGT